MQKKIVKLHRGVLWSKIIKYRGGTGTGPQFLEMFCEADCGVGILCNGLLQALILVFGCSA